MRVEPPAPRSSQPAPPSALRSVSLRSAAFSAFGWRHLRQGFRGCGRSCLVGLALGWARWCLHPQGLRAFGSGLSRLRLRALVPRCSHLPLGRGKGCAPQPQPLAVRLAAQPLRPQPLRVLRPSLPASASPPSPSVLAPPALPQKPPLRQKLAAHLASPPLRASVRGGLASVRGWRLKVAFSCASLPPQRGGRHRKVLRWSPPTRVLAELSVFAGVSGVFAPLTAVLPGLACFPQREPLSPRPPPARLKAASPCGRCALPPLASLSGCSGSLLVGGSLILSGSVPPCAARRCSHSSSPRGCSACVLGAVVSSAFSSAPTPHWAVSLRSSFSNDRPTPPSPPPPGAGGCWTTLAASSLCSG